MLTVWTTAKWSGEQGRAGERVQKLNWAEMKSPDHGPGEPGGEKGFRWGAPACRLRAAGPTPDTSLGGDRTWPPPLGWGGAGRTGWDWDQHVQVFSARA